MSCAQLVAEYAASDPTYRVYDPVKGRTVSRCFHCGEDGANAASVDHASSCFWARCVRHEQPTVTVR